MILLGPPPTSASATDLVAAILTLPHKIVLAIAGFLFLIGKRPINHEMNLSHKGILAIPICGVYMRDALTQHASVSAFAWLNLRKKSISTTDLRTLGFAPPKGHERFRWLVFRTPDDRKVYATAHDILAALGMDAPHPQEDQTPFASFDPGHIPEREDKHFSCRCPIHNDTKASATLFPRSHRGYGAGICHACQGPDGMPLRFCWRQLDDGTPCFRIARKHREESNDGTQEKPAANVGRYNRRPIGGVAAGLSQDSGAGLLLATTSRHLANGAVGVRLQSRMYRSYHSSFLRYSPVRGDVINAIIRADKNADYGNIRPKVLDYEFEVAARRQEYTDTTGKKAPLNGQVPDRLIAIQPQRVSAYYTMTVHPSNGGSPFDQYIPTSYEDLAVQNVLFDFDGLVFKNDGSINEWAKMVLNLVKRDSFCSGRATVVQTSGTGVQVVVELVGAILKRDDIEAWWSKDGPRRWFAKLGGAMLNAAHDVGAQGGELDGSGFNGGRLCRRPGWRIAKDGEAYRAWLVDACNERRVATADQQRPKAVELVVIQAA